MTDHRMRSIGGPIDRHALVSRQDVLITEILPTSPLSVGNGDFCFTADVTGLQSLPEAYPVGPRDPSAADGTLLGTQSTWGWHSVPPPEPYRLEDSMVTYESPRGPVSYVDMGGAVRGGTEQGTPARDLWLRANPHRLDLGRIGFVEPGGAGLDPAKIIDVRQRLDLYRGELRSDFRYAGQPISVITVVDPDRDQLAVRIEAPDDTVAIGIAFPYGSQDWHNAADWTAPERHTTDCTPVPGGWRVDRQLDDTSYQVDIATDAVITETGAHQQRIDLQRPVTELVFRFGIRTGDQPRLSFAEIRRRCHDHWQRFWQAGGAVELADCPGDQPAEIERRTVLSQYLTAIQCAGSLPPQETGLTCNSWRGRFHLEMHYWHAAHFALWGRPELLIPSLRWYATALPEARRIARRQGFPGARWPKQIGPDLRESPSGIGPFLVWQQPHPIHLAELAYRARPDPQLLDDLADVVFATADFMAGFAVRTERGYELGPPLIPAQESYGGIRQEVWNPTFELVYWAWALRIACAWSRRLGREPDPRWQTVADRMLPPQPRDGRYPAIGVPPWVIRTDHPSMLCALGVLPQTDRIDPAVMAATLDDVLADWDWSTTWGWDYPVLAMTAARLGRPGLAVSALLMGEHKNTALPNGHNRQSASLPLYLPGNGGLLTAVGLMAAGWDDGPERSAPGFPSDWPVRAEGLVRAP